MTWLGISFCARNMSVFVEADGKSYPPSLTYIAIPYLTWVLYLWYNNMSTTDGSCRVYGGDEFESRAYDSRKVTRTILRIFWPPLWQRVRIYNERFWQLPNVVTIWERRVDTLLSTISLVEQFVDKPCGLAKGSPLKSSLEERTTSRSIIFWQQPWGLPLPLRP